MKPYSNENKLRELVCSPSYYTILMGAKRKTEIAKRSTKNDFSLLTHNINNNRSTTTTEKGSLHATSTSTSDSPDTGRAMKEVFECIGTNFLFRHEKEQVQYDFLLVPRCFINRSLLTWARNFDSFPLETNSIGACLYDKKNYLSKLTDNNCSNIVLSEIKPADTNEVFKSDSCIWIPPNREHWDSCIDEMTALCDTATHFRNENQQLSPLLGGKKTKLEIGKVPSVPKAYISDRIDIDDPLFGYQIRHRSGGWLQGFVLITTFTTWTCYFKWDSLHAKSGMLQRRHPTSSYRDSTGSFSAELEKQPRSGDPHQGGVVWSTIAEISIVGGLGCGELLLRTAMDESRRRGYDYVALQATESSRSFYEKLGFCRVGAIARYLRNRDNNTLRSIVGYRHWTYADEKNLAHHGKPSIMMVKRIHNSCLPFLDLLSSYFVETKPMIRPLSPTELCVNECSNNLLKRNICDARETDVYQDNSDSVKSCARKKIRIVHCSSSVGTNSPGTVAISKMANIVPTSPSKHNNNLDSVPQDLNSYFGAEKNIDMFARSKNVVDLREYTDREGEVSCMSTPVHILKKQKVTHLRRDNSKPAYFNKVVSQKKKDFKSPKAYFFVTNYDSERSVLSLVQLESIGMFKGNRDGRRKWKAKPESMLNAVGGSTTVFNIFTVSNYSWEIVLADIVTKTNLVAKESWDIHDL